MDSSVKSVETVNQQISKNKKKIILYRACAYKSAGSFAPFGLLQIASSLLNAGYKVVIIDGNQTEDVIVKAMEYLDEDVLCTGVSAAAGHSIIEGLKFSRFMKEHNIPVIWGGTQAGMLPELTLSCEYVDFIIKGEGEETFLELAQNLYNKDKYKEIDGVGYKDNGKLVINKERSFVDLNKYTSPPFHLVENFEEYLTPHLSLPGCKRVYRLFTNRGCYFKCTFCYNGLVNKNSWRTLTPENIIKQINVAKKKFNIDGLQLAGDNFFMDKTVALKTAELMIKERVNLKWCASCPAITFNTFDDEYISILQESGLQTINSGIEVGSDRRLKFLKKCITMDGVLRYSEKLKKHKLHARVSFMIGLPHETEEDLFATISLMEKLSENPYILVGAPGIYRPLPGTELYHDAVNMGFKEDRMTLESWAKVESTERSVLPFSKKYKDLLISVLYYWKIRSAFNSQLVDRILKKLSFLFFHNDLIPFLLGRTNLTMVERCMRNLLASLRGY